MLKALIVNLDSQTQHFVLTQCKASKLFETIEVYTDINMAINEIKRKPFNCLIFDPQNSKIPEQGFSFLDYINLHIPTIIISKNPNLAFKAYDYRNVVDYLVTPFDEPRFQESLWRIKDNNYTPPTSNDSADTSIYTDYIFLNVDKKLVRIELQDIKYIVSKGDYITVYTNMGQFTSYGTLKSLRPKMPKDRFVDIHRSYLINLDHVVDIENNSVLIGKTIIPISRLKKKKFLQQLHCI